MQQAGGWGRFRSDVINVMRLMDKLRIQPIIKSSLVGMPSSLPGSCCFTCRQQSSEQTILGSICVVLAQAAGGTRMSEGRGHVELDSAAESWTRHPCHSHRSPSARGPAGSISTPRWRRTAVTCFTFELRSCLEVCTCPPAGHQPSHRMLSEPCLEEVCVRAGGGGVTWVSWLEWLLRFKCWV